MKNMTIDELKKAAAKYADENCSASDDYNPYRSEIDLRERMAEMNKPQTLEDRMYAILSTLERIDTASARESGTHDAEKVAALRAEYNDIKDEIEDAKDAAFAAEWTKDVTIARREEWNGYIRAMIDSKTGKISTADVNRKARKLGWGIDQINKAKALHGIK